MPCADRIQIQFHPVYTGRHNENKIDSPVYTCPNKVLFDCPVRHGTELNFYHTTPSSLQRGERPIPIDIISNILRLPSDSKLIENLTIPKLLNRCRKTMISNAGKNLFRLFPLRTFCKWHTIRAGRDSSSHSCTCKASSCTVRYELEFYFSSAQAWNGHDNKMLISTCLIEKEETEF